MGQHARHLRSYDRRVSPALDERAECHGWMDHRGIFHAPLLHPPTQSTRYLQRQNRWTITGNPAAHRTRHACRHRFGSGRSTDDLDRLRRAPGRRRNSHRGYHRSLCGSFSWPSKAHHRRQADKKTHRARCRRRERRPSRGRTGSVGSLLHRGCRSHSRYEPRHELLRSVYRGAGNRGRGVFQPDSTRFPPRAWERRSSAAFGSANRSAPGLMGLRSGSSYGRHSLWQITLPASPESEDAISEGLWDKTGQHPSFYRDEETQTSVARVYLSAKPGRIVVDELTKLLENVRQSGLHVPKSTIRIARLARQDWAESWKRHFKPLQIGRRLLVRPSWIKRRGPKGSAIFVLDPGLSFGTGQHPTTRFCLEQLVKRRRRNQPQSFLDVGSGSGILAIAAKKLGYQPVDALEIDPDAVRIARRNVRKNHLSGKVRIVCKDLSLLP